MSETNQRLRRLEEIHRRIAQKRVDYGRYNFSQLQNDILKTFFDLAQEYGSLEDFYRISVVVLKEFMGVEARLYLINESSNALEFVCDSSTGLQAEGVAAPSYMILSAKMYTVEGAVVVPIVSKMSEGVSESHRDKDLLLGMLKVEAPRPLTPQDQFFLGKFANRIGFNLHNRRLTVQNIKHLKFINNLVMDIEHNVIIPNMYFKHLFNRIRSKILDVEELEKKMRGMKESMQTDTMQLSGASCEEIIKRVSTLHQDLIDCHQEMLKHHNNCSLFLESLFRRDHFEKGHLVLHSKKCFVEREIILPQLEQFTRRLEAQGITIERPTDMSTEQIPLRVDVGLLSQVYANYFSNAVKYTEEIIDHKGRVRKAIAYGRTAMPDYFGQGSPGVKFNIFTTGPHLDDEDAREIYTEGFRGKNSAKQSGSGHGLTFVKQVVEMHGGEAGYEATEEGNNFFFILPLEEI
ncbi:MAG: HAMP domain-containing histidine kinase [Deltaproteobacteria bacterium]|nr:HAMP domain-containing histidine kinase [Deltaproteobacteria bacterium]